MFIQLVQGRVRDEAGVRRCMEQWQRDLMPGATGFLGATSGFGDDGTFITLARFEDEKSARANSDRAEQGRWWDEFTSCFHGELTVHDLTHVEPWLGGGSDRAGFVQIMEGHSPDVRRLTDLMQQHGDRIQQERPDIIGALLANDGRDRYVEAIYFTSEREAREHEKMQIPDDLRSIFDEEMSLMGEISYVDLHQPMLMSAR